MDIGGLRPDAPATVQAQFEVASIVGTMLKTEGFGSPNTLSASLGAVCPCSILLILLNSRSILA